MSCGCYAQYILVARLRVETTQEPFDSTSYSMYILPEPREVEPITARNQAHGFK
jgi:hypothetical protein